MSRNILIISRKCIFVPLFSITLLLFVEYRAELYWRLESKRMKALSKENTPFNGVSVDQNNNLDHEELNEAVSDN